MYGFSRRVGPSGAEDIDLGAAVLRVNMADAVEVAIRSGLGIGVLPGRRRVGGTSLR